MLEYLFFDPGLRDKFATFLAQEGVACQFDDEEACLAYVSDDVDEAVGDRIDEYYEILLQENAELLEGTEEGLEKDAAGVTVELADGTACNILVEPELLSRVLESITMEELRDLMQTIATGVERRDTRSMCQIVAAGG